jgi:hypothetical protein
MLTCGTCDRSLIGERQKGHIYYRCHHSTCKGTSVSQEDVEEVVKEQLGLIYFSDRELASLRAIVEYLKEDWVVQKDTEEKSLRLQLGQIQERLNRLVDAFLDGNVEKDLYEDRKRQLLLDRVDREEQLTTLKATSTSGAEKVLEFVELAKTAQLRYEMGTPDEKRDLVKLVMSNLVVSGKCVSTRLSFPYSEVAKRPDFARGGPQRIIGRTLKNWVLQIGAWYIAQKPSWEDTKKSWVL